MRYPRSMVSLRASLIAGLDGDVRVHPGHFKRAIVRVVVHYNQLDIAIILLPNANQATLYRASGITGRYDNRNERQLDPPHESHPGKTLFVRKPSGDGATKGDSRLVPRVVFALRNRLLCEPMI